MSVEEIRRTIREHIRREFLPDESPDALTDATPLISGGVLDSISTIKLVSYLEQHFKIEFEAHEVNQERLDTVSSIADTILSKQTG